jgi:hypothetical protein
MYLGIWYKIDKSVNEEVLDIRFNWDLKFELT